MLALHGAVASGRTGRGLFGAAQDQNQPGVRFFVRDRLPYVLLSAMLISAPLPSKAEVHTLWTIGKPDQSRFEFHAEPAQHIVYRVGKSDWAREWPTLQRLGTAYEIQFELKDAPRGRFALRTALLLPFASPDLQMEINGHRGLAFTSAQPLYSGDGGAWDDKTIVLPTQYLVKGTNTLVLSTVAHINGAGERVTPGGPLRYDYLSLTQDESAAYVADEVQATVTPSIFYRRTAAGKLVEAIEAKVHFNREIPSGEATLKLEGRSYTAPLKGEPRFGDVLLEYEVSEWQGPSKATLELGTPGGKTFPLSLTPAKKWTVFIVPHTHVDIGYTDFQGKVAEGQAAALEEAEDLIASTPDFRYATDGSWNVEQLVNARSGAGQKRLFDLVRAGKLGVPVDYFNLLTGYASLETLYRSLFYTKHLSATEHIPFSYATTTDVPSYSAAYATVLATSGVKYWAVGGNQDRAPVLTGEEWNQLSPFWWKGPDGHKVLFSYSWSYSHIGRFFSLQPTNEAIHASLPMFLAQFDRAEYKPDAALMYGAQNENTALHPELANFVPGWNHAYAYPTLKYALFADYFDYISREYGDQLPVRSGDLGSYWEDGIAADAFYAGVDRQNQADALSVEIASAAAHDVNAEYVPPKEEIRAAWNHILLFAEHTWGAGNSVSQPDSMQSAQQLAVKDNFATQARFELDDIKHRSMFELTRAIRVPNGGLVVFNALNWDHSGFVEADLKEGEAIEDFKLHQDVAFEVMSKRDNVLHVRFMATDVPAVGYKCYQIHAANKATAELVTSLADSIENEYYRIVVDPATGAVKSILDKELKRDLVDASSPYRFGEYLYVTGGDPAGDGQTQMIHPNKALPAANLTIHRAVSGKCLGAEKTPWGELIRLQAANVNTPGVALEIRLFNSQKKIEFDYIVQKNATRAKEAVYFAFPTAVSHPRFAYSAQVGWVDPVQDILRGGDTEWFSVQHWMAAYDAGLSVSVAPVDAPLATFGDINRGAWPVKLDPKSATMFSYAMNNYWHTNYRAAQGGEFHFRYVVTSDRVFNPAAFTRMGAESRQAMFVDRVATQDKAGKPSEQLPAEGESFLRIDNPNVLLTTWKIAENGKGTVVRLEEIAGKDERVELRASGSSVRSARLCNAMEDELSEIPVKEKSLQLTVKAHEVVTLKLLP